MVRGALVRVPLLSLWVVMGVAHAATPGGSDEIDDPKLARRLKTRGALPAAALDPPPSARPAEGTLLVDQTSNQVSSPTSNSTSGPTETLTAPGLAAARDQPPRQEAGRTPVIGIGYRRFSFVQVGATNSSSTTGVAASEPFDSVSLDFYPISRFVRFGLSTQYGWQSGRFNSGGGDYFIAQSASLGIQSAGQRVSPFAEAFAGGGYMRRFQFDRTIPTAYWQFGIDAGASFFLADHGFMSLALGYLRPVNGFLKEQTFTSVYVDTWSVKLGFGL